MEGFSVRIMLLTVLLQVLGECRYIVCGKLGTKRQLTKWVACYWEQLARCPLPQIYIVLKHQAKLEDTEATKTHTWTKRVRDRERSGGENEWENVSLSVRWKMSERVRERVSERMNKKMTELRLWELECKVKKGMREWMLYREWENH